MPVEHNFPLKEVLRVLESFSRRVTFEYVMIRGFNDRPEDIPLLAEIARPIGALINLIPLHPGGPRELAATSVPDIHRFATRLRQLGVNVTVRKSRGVDINAACGQLWSDAARSGKVSAQQHRDVQKQE
jgi:23S rRNA (adenine2503-C2)-methyltransferase